MQQILKAYLLKFGFILLLTGVLGINPVVNAEPNSISFSYDQFQGDLTETPNNQNSSDILLRQAFSLENIGENSLAIKKYQEFFQKKGEGSFARSSYASLFLKQNKLENSLKQIEKAIKINNQNSEYVVHKLDLLRKLKRNEDALTYAQKKYNNFGKIIPGIEFQLAELLFKKKNFKQALFHYRQVLYALKGKGVRANVYRNISLWRVSHILINSKNYSKAKTYLERYIKLNDKSYYARFVLAEYIYLANGDFSTALKLFKKIHKLSKKDFNSSNISRTRFLNFYTLSCYANRNICFLSALEELRKTKKLNSFELAMHREWFKRDRQAIILLLRLVKKKPRSLYLRFAFLNVLERSKRKDLYIKSLFQASLISYQQRKLAFFKYFLNKAADQIKKYPELKSWKYDYLLNESYYYFLKQDYHRAASSIYAALDLNSKKQTNKSKQRLHLRRAFYLGQSSDKSVFLEGLKQAKIIADCNACANQSDAQSISGILFMDKHDWKNSIHYLDQAFQKTNSMKNRFWIGASYYEMGKEKKGIKIIEEVLKSKYAIKHYSQNFLAFHFAKNNVQLNRALELSKQSLIQNPLNYNRHDTIGYIYYKTKKYKKAFYHFKTSLAILELKNQNNPEIVSHLADAYFKTGDTKSARAWYKRALHLMQKKIKHLSKRKANAKELRLLKRLEVMKL